MADEVGRVVECGNCGEALATDGGEAEADRQPCPQCGSTDRLVKLHLESKLTLRAMLSMKAKPTVGRWFKAVKTGAEFFHKTARWHRVERILDRRGNRYFDTSKTRKLAMRSGTSKSR